MKTQCIILPFIAIVAVGLASANVCAGEAKKIVAGPNGGRVVTTVEPRAEFFVLPDRKVQITFLDRAGKVVPPADQIVTVTAGERMSPTTLTFAKAGNKLISNIALPPGEAVPAVVQIKTTPGTKAAIEKFNVDLAKCGECKNAEYACICGH